MLIQALRAWDRRRWVAAATGGVAVASLVGLPTDVIPNPVFGRPVPVTWWSIPVLVATALLGGLLVATYVRPGGPAHAAGPGTGVDADALDRPGRVGGLGGALAFFAVGCPVCNKLVVLALGTSGALSWFQPLQPALAAGSVALLAVAVRARLRGEVACPLPR